MTNAAEIVEVGPRDGLQSEARFVATADKVRLIDLLSACGLKTIETTSFVSPKWVPQLADASEVMGKIRRVDGLTYLALTPNIEGYRRAREASIEAIAVFASASEGFSRRNINCSISESLDRFAPVLTAAKSDGVTVRGYVSCITDCPYDGAVAPEKVARVCGRLLDAGCSQISLGDTLGSATPETVSALLETIVDTADPRQLAGHFHDTRARAVDNIKVCLSYGLRVFDASAGGLGGCPYAPGAGGNVATGVVADLLTSLGYETGLDRNKLAEAERFARSLKGQP